MFNKIKRHLELANKGYFEHMFFAMKIGLKCLWSFFTAFIHAINPAWFEYTTSKRIKRMNDLFQKPNINQSENFIEINKSFSSPCMLDEVEKK
ncbi:MAG: hypothetical protein RLZ52_755 [Pseudomonadota bacterium]|jgi:hypothetical protein